MLDCDWSSDVCSSDLGLSEDDLIVDVEVLSSDEMAGLMAEQDVVYSF
jgi:sulfur relay (sulfurtransferase) DsrF/TusC family protein